jgi:hypothetical protein
LALVGGWFDEKIWVELSQTKSFGLLLKNLRSLGYPVIESRGRAFVSKTPHDPLVKSFISVRSLAPRA